MLTLIYAGVLVVALAVSLVMIWVYLRRISGSLAKARRALARVDKETAPLKEPLQALEKVSVQTAEQFSNARWRMAQAEEQVTILTE